MSWKTTRGDTVLTKWLFWESEVLQLNHHRLSQQFESRPVGNLEGSAQDPTSEAPKLLLTQQTAVVSNATQVCVWDWVESAAPGCFSCNTSHTIHLRLHVLSSLWDCPCSLVTALKNTRAPCRTNTFPRLRWQVRKADEKTLFVEMKCSSSSESKQSYVPPIQDLWKGRGLRSGCVPLTWDPVLLSVDVAETAESVS